MKIWLFNTLGRNGHFGPSKVNTHVEKEDSHGDDIVAKELHDKLVRKYLEFGDV